MTLAPDASHPRDDLELPELPGRTLAEAELRDWVERLAARPELWRHHVAHDSARERAGGRHYVSLHRDEHVDVWLLCWDTVDDTGWHDHDTSAGAVVVTDGAVVERRPRLGGEAASRTVPAGRSFAFGPDHIHRMSGAVDGSVSIHAYSPPLWRMGQYAISDDGVMRRWSVSYADELRPVEDDGHALVSGP
ncbi:cysteine dioxygenase family protein [uncultured Nocardioides sp.]|uniref:cysteine dioxygenase n=1 Tax=uncultured Nocardioides sp. TaxID=198441 RepID=UPI00261264EE|nr:cysteine dioxygenase family protein [uncultured Nocardioides sp.]